MNRCKEACDTMLKLLKGKDLARVKGTLDLLECCSKNGNLFLHKIIA